MNIKVVCLNSSEIEIGNETVIADNCEIVAKQGADISIGSSVSISHNNRLASCDRKILIGDDSLFSYDIAVDQNHYIYDKNANKFCCDTRDTIIGNHVWVGKGAFIMPGSKIGEGSIVGALSFVNIEFPDHSEIVGSPAKIIKKGIEWKK